MICCIYRRTIIFNQTTIYWRIHKERKHMPLFSCSVYLNVDTILSMYSRWYLTMLTKQNLPIWEKYDIRKHFVNIIDLKWNHGSCDDIFIIQLKSLPVCDKYHWSTSAIAILGHDVSAHSYVVYYIHEK